MMEAAELVIHIPTPLRQFVGGEPKVEVSGGTVAEALANLTERHPGLRNHLFGPDGKLRAFVNVYVNDEDVRYLDRREHTPLKPADTLSIVPSIAGGAAG
jgi:adenylyltransferase/sulfurtransferase